VYADPSFAAALKGARAALELGRGVEARSLAREARTLAARIGDDGSAQAADQIIAAAG
jgi:hypothetical protein